MNLRLLSLEPAMRMLGWLLLLTAGLSFFQAGIVNWLMLDKMKGIMDWSMIGVMLRFPIATPVLFVLVFAISKSYFRGSFSEYELSLPKLGRILLGYRFLTRLILALAPLVCALMVTLWITKEPKARDIVLTCAFNMACGLMLCLFIHMLQTRKGGFWLSLALIVSLGLMVVGTFIDSTWFGATLIGLALPASLALYGMRNEPIHLTREAELNIPSVDREILTPKQALRRTILRHTLLFKLNIAMCISVVIFMFLYHGQPGVNVMGYVMPFFFAVVISSNSAMALRRLGHLPISRQRLYPYVILPGLCCLWIGLSLGDFNLFHLIKSKDPAVALDYAKVFPPEEEKEYHNQVKVPHVFWRVSMGLPDPIKSQWGEQKTPAAHGVFPGIPIYLYNPFEVDDACSVEFASWQLHRALMAVYGEALPQQEIQEKYIYKTSRNRLDTHRKWEAEWEAWQEGRTPILQGKHRMIKFFLLGLAWFALHFTIFGLITPATRAKRTKRIILWSSTGVVCVFLFIIYPFVFYFKDMDGSTALMHSVFGLFDHFHPLFLLLVLVLCYKLTEIRFKRMELPDLQQGPGVELTKKAMNRI